MNTEQKIPDEIKNQIQSKTIEYANESGYIKQIAIPAFNDGAYFGYQLGIAGRSKGLERQKELEEENKSLKKNISRQSNKSV